MDTDHEADDKKSLEEKYNGAQKSTDEALDDLKKELGMD